MSYYNRYGHQLPASSMKAPSSSNNSIKSESGVRSPAARNMMTSQTIHSLTNTINNSTILPPADSSKDPANFIPTPNISSVTDNLTFGGYNREITDLCDRIPGLLYQDMPTVQEEIRHEVTADASSALLENPMFDPNQRLTPVKFSTPHVKGVFSARGVFMKLDAKSPHDGQSGNQSINHNIYTCISILNLKIPRVIS